MEERAVSDKGWYRMPFVWAVEEKKWVGQWRRRKTSWEKQRRDIVEWRRTRSTVRDG